MMFVTIVGETIRLAPAFPGAERTSGAIGDSDER